jgi:peroxiredoxin
VSQASAAGPRLPARVGMLLAQPTSALRLYDEAGGGVRDAAWLVLLGVACFRLEDVMRALLGITHLSASTVVRQMFAALSHEVQEAVLIVLPAAVGVTVLAGRGHRDPSRDLELGAACYVPFFAARAVYRALDLDVLLGPLPRVVNQISSSVGLVGALVVLALAVRVARARPPATAEPKGATPSTPAPPVAVPGLPARLSATALAAFLGAALFVNAGWVIRNADAIRPLRRGGQAPEFSLPRIDGQPGDLALVSMRGKVVLLDFWATWCAPCVHMMDTLHKLHDEWQPRGVEFVGINSDGAMASPEDVRRFLRERPAPYPMVIDESGQVASLYKVVALPHMVLMGRDGSIRKTFWGVTSHDELAEALAAAVQ